MPQITCPACAATYDMPVGAIGPDGRKVRCAACKTLWLARTEPARADMPTAPYEASSAPQAVAEVKDEPQAGAPPAMDQTPPVAEPEMLPPEPEVAPTAKAAKPSALKAPPRRRKPWHERIGERIEAPRARWPIAASVAVLACLAGTVGLRKSIVAHAPDTGRLFAAIGLPVNLTGLDLKNVRSGVFNEGGVELLVIQGEITNISAVNKPVPRLKFAIRDARGLEIYTWTAQAEMKDLKPGESQTFRRRLASPPPEGSDVLVRFAGKADLIAMAK